MLTKDQTAPNISSSSIGGQPIDLSALRGKRVLVKFHRFSGCPVAQNQIHELIERQTELNASGIETIVLMHNSREKIEPIYKEVPGLHIIADRQKKFYRLYDSEFTWKALFSLASWRITFISFFKGYYPRFNRFQGGIIAVPSDFLINEKGAIVNLHYGKHFGDSWSVSEVLVMA
jgi:peroxiredoxin Q/BCP